ncbi:amino acid adenylation domain-containing protein, partial [Corallococcus praedator]
MPPGAPVRAPQNVSAASVTAPGAGVGPMAPVPPGTHGTVAGTAPQSGVPATYGAQGSMPAHPASGAQGAVPTASATHGTQASVPAHPTSGSVAPHTASYGAQDTASSAFGTPSGEESSSASAPFAGRAPATQSGQGALAPTGRVATVTLSPTEAPAHAGPSSPNLPTASGTHPFGATPPPVSVPSIAQSLHEGAYHPTGAASHPAPEAAHSSARPLLPGLSAHTASEAVAPAAVPAGREDAPRGDVEERVAALWRERLGLDFVGREENFLEIGGNSLTAAQLLNQVRDTFGVQLPLAALFEAPTVAGIAQRLEPLLRQAPQAQVSVELPLVPLPRTRELALSFVQERVWRLEQHLPGLSAYNIPFVLRLDGVVEAEILERGIQEIVHRHEALRTTYDVVDGRPVQRFHAHVRIPLTRVDLRGPLETREAEALRIAREDAAAPFDLVNGPVMRSTLVRLDTHVHMLVVSIHHIVCDTLSVALFVQELGQLYDAFIQGRPSPLPPLPIQYADFGQWQRQSIAEARLPEQEQWWRQRLAGMPRQIDLPTDRPRTAHSRTLNSARMTMELPPALARELSAFSRREGFTPYMTVLAAWQTLLHRYSGQTDLIVGTPIANRTRPELFPLIGYVAHSAAFRTRFVGEPTFRDMLAQIREEVNDAQARPDVPFEYLVEALVPGKDIGKGRMADSVFVFHSGVSAGAMTLELKGMRGSLVEVPGTPVQWGATLADLTLVLSESPGRLHGVLEYATELFDAAFAEHFMAHFQVLLSAALSKPDTQVSRLPLSTEAERRAWPTPRTVAGFTSVPALLADRRARQADAIAVSRGDAHWTWGQLGTQVRTLAERLRSLGVKDGAPVAVSLRPSPEKLIALWAVLEAGGAVVTLSPTDLGEVSLYAPEGARVPVLVTSRELVASVRVEASRTLYVEDVATPSEASIPEVPGRDGADTLAWLLPMGAGQPAWALGHLELSEFFVALDARLSPTDGGAWLSAGEAAADRPDLEALWALSRGLRVVFPSEQVTARLVNLGGAGRRAKAMDLSLIYFANDEDTLTGPKYELLIEGSKFADANGFSAVWTPERHFASFGGLYPQPAVVAAGVATVTKNLRLRSGSVVLPLHDPLLIAEQWSVVDNLSQGRVGMSVATGWHVHDFTFAPGNYEDRRNILLKNLKTLRALWRGEKVTRPAGAGTTVELSLRPKPVQKELPVWLTATANPETFRLAGELGAGVLTGLMSHSLEEMKPKVALYREAWRRNGHPGRGHITVMLHTYLGDDEAEVFRTVRQPLLGYFRGSTDIVTSLLAAQGYQGEINKLSPDDINALLEHTFEHHAKMTGLVGSMESGLKRLRELQVSDVDEVAALIDFGLETPVVLEGLRRLARVRELLESEAAARQEQVLVESGQGVESLLALAKQSGAVLVHTSARLARSLTELPGARDSLGSVGALVLEDASSELASALHRTAGVEVLLSGSAVEGALLPRAPGERVPSSLQTWVLDPTGQPVPVGVVGELALSGAGLPRGLWRAEEEGHRRLVPHPTEVSSRLYRTGRHARMRADGRVEPVTLPSRLPAPVARPKVEAPRPVAPSVPGAPPPIPLVPRNQPLPLSFAQQRLWYIQQLEPQSGAYNNATTFRLTGELDVAALQAALDELVARHEVLRTTYSLEGETAVQLIHPARGLPLARVDVTGETPEAREAELVRLCQAHAVIPFDLEKLVIRALLLRVEPKMHVLALVLHHAVSDAWCTMVLARELTVLYATYSAGMKSSPLPPLPIQYADYAVWQRDWLEGGVMEAQVSWWNQQLLGAPTLVLPTDRPRPAAQSFAGALYRFQFPADVAEPLLALGRKQGATTFMVMMALFQTLLSRYSGQDDFVVGTPLAGRTRPEVEGLIGCFVNTLAFRSRLEGAPSFTELLGRVRTQALESYARQDAPFERILDTLGLPRDLSRTPLFQVVLNVLNTPDAKAQLPSLELTPVEVSTGTSKFDLGLDVWENRAGLTCRFEYPTALFDEATLARMAEHFVELARQVTANPEAPLSRLSLMGGAERQRVLVEWNATGGEYPREACIQDLFMAQAAMRPNAVALEFGDTRLTYAELDARTNQWAHLLREQGVGPDVLVAVCLERSIELIVSLLAILKAGGAYLPLDAAYPAQRLAAMLEDAPPRLLLTTQEVRDNLAVDDALPCLFVEELRLEGRPTSPVQAGTQARHLAYVDFTSGSTGRPKGVAVEHRGVLRLLHNASFVDLGPDVAFLHISPVSFDASTLEIWAPLLFGGRLVVFPPSSPSDLELLASTLQHHRVTTMWLTAGLFAQVVELKPEALKGMRQVLTGGDVVPAHHVRRVLEDLGVSVSNGYGPTETTVFASTYRLTDAAQVGTSIPIGRPVNATQLYVMDRHGQPVPPGVAGELFIGGDGLARGYLSRPDLTAERFVPNPFAATQGERLYRTGDLARWRPDGVVEFLGRVDHQVKVRGFRIELAEVEAALRAHAYVREAVAVVREDVPGDKRLVAYFVPSEDLDLDPAVLRTFLEQRLPDYMLPSAFVPLTALPLTANAKLDRKALPAPEGLRASRREYIEPRTEMEQRLAGIWTQVLRVERVSVDDNFFDLGGDSIISIQVVARARQAGVRISVRDLFQHPTLGALANVAKLSAGSVAEQGPVVGEVPLTPIQLELLEGDPEHAHHFNMPVLLRARQPLQPVFLEQALQLLISHHDALRLRFTREGTCWRQHNASPEDASFQLLQVDLSGLPPEDRPRAMEEHAERLQARFDLARPPLVRAALFHFSPGQEQRLLLLIHHLVVDAVSWRVLVEDLETAYLQLSARRPAVLPGKTTSFLSWTRRLETHALSDALHAQTPLWLDEARKDVAPLPVDSAGPNTHGSQRAVSIQLDAEETRLLLQETSAGWRARINDVLLTALALALREWTGQSSALIDVEGHGRQELFADADVSRTVGWFTSMAPALLRLPLGGTPGDSLRAVRDTLSQWPDQGIGFGLLRFMGPPDLRQRMAAFPRAQVAFNYLGQLDGASDASTLFSLGDDPVGTSVAPTALRTHVLVVNGSVRDGRLGMYFGFSHHLHHASTIETLAQRFLTVLRTLIEQRHSEDSRRMTPGDFPLARLTQPALDGLLASQGPTVEDLYPLSALQQGLLFHVLATPESSFYFEQRSWSIHSAVDIGLFRKTWQAAVDRNPILRTSFVWRDLGAPLQVVHSHAELPFEEHDWRHLPPEEQQAGLTRMLAAERTRGFDVTRAPLMRMVGVRLSDTHWRFIWNHHHLLLDGWSSGLFFEEVFALYDTFRSGATPAPSTRPPFRDYIAWLQQTDIASDERFWRARLSGLSVPTPVPAEQPSTARPGDPVRMQSAKLFLSSEDTTALQAFARQHQLTLNTLVQAAWALVLARYAGTQDVIFGTTLAGRPPELPGAEAMLGMLITTLPVRIQLPDEQAPVLPWLQSLQTQQRALEQHQHTPLVTAASWSDMPRGTPLFNTLMIFENFPLDESVMKRSTELDIRDLLVAETSHYPLSAMVVPGNELLFNLGYDPSRFSKDAVDRVLGHWTRALLSLTRPSALLSDVSMLSSAERQQVLVEWNTPARGYPDVRIHDLFEQQADLRPDAIALEFAEQRLSYAQLDARANQLAHLLRQHGVGPDSLVALCLERSVELIVSLLAILKAGGAYVPLDASYPVQRLSAMLEDAPPQVLITSRTLRSTLPVSQEVPCLLVEELRLEEQPASRPVTATLPRHLAYVDFTSGSTGRPKGVAVEHRNVLRLLHDASYVDLGPDTVFLLISPISFDASTLEVWGPLLFGGRLVVFPPSSPSDLELLASTVHRHRVNTLFLTAGLFAQVVELKLDALRGVRQVITGGDVVPAPQVRRVLETLGIPVSAGYGPTETTVFASTHRMTDAAQVGTSIPIGRPLRETQLYVLDANGQPVPPGIPGELFIGGEGLARGYLSRPDLTAERFVPHPFSATQGERLYRTGDLARWRPDGVVEFLGRVDHQVKVRGFRIELAEVEAALRAHAAVREAVAVVREDVPGDKRLVAYVALHQDVEPAVLRAFLAQRLPEYMLPSLLVPLAALPLTPNGKVDRKALPAPEVSQPAASTYVAPETPTEIALATLWSEVLRIPAVGRHDNFFELGGHSLLATQVVSRIRSTLGVELPLGDLFSAPTVATLAEKLGRASRTQAPPLVRAERTTAPPLSFAQQRLWFIDQLEPGTTLYNLPLPLRFTGALDEGALRRSLDALMARHESLRTTFRVDAGQPVQHIHAGATVPFESVDLTDIADATERQAEAKRRGSAEFHRPFNLEQGPVIRALLLKLDAQEHVLVLHLHHIVSDGWSLGVLVREMTALYEAFRQGHAPALPSLPVQYADYAVWQRGWLQGDVLEAQLDWWKQQLAGASHVLELPTDKPRPAVASRRGDAVSVHLPRVLAEKVEALAQREGATPFMVLLAAFQSVLHRYSGQDDVLVGSPIANRGHAETEGLIGFFVNTLVLRGSFGARPSFRQLVAQVRTTTLGAYEHQDIPFERLVESLQTTRDLSRTPLFQVMFALQNAPLPELVLPGLSVKGADIGGRGTSQFELSLDLNREADGFVGHIDYATDLFERSTVERLMTHLRVLLEAALERPDAPLADLSFVGPEERQRLLGDLSGSAVDFDSEATLHGRIERQVARTPSADAVAFGDTMLSFRQLDARANQLARHLRSLGVGPEVTVGLCLERSADSIVALLAVLKADGAFVPIDPAAPAARRSFILGDSRASVLLTTQALAEAWRPDVGAVVCLDAEQKPWAELSSETPASNVGPENLAYVLYTSGSTGTPKGVAVQHRSVLHLHQAMARDIYVQPQRGLRVSVNAPLFFDASMEQVIQLLDGDCLCLVPDETRKDPEVMLSWLEAQRIDSLDCTPSQLKLLLDAGLLERAHVPALLIVGGEAMDEVTWRRLSTTKRTRAFNVYGPTETTVNATAWALQDAAQSLPVIGRPLDNVRAYILDAQQRLVPFGMQGELCLSGEGLARGYLGRPDLTAARFVPNPFSTEPGARLYRTGDKARWREDGTLDFMGRLDFQVKLRGYRIELGEIEATLRSHPGIRDAVALVREDVAGDARLVAYVVPEVDTSTLREHLRKHLPEYMVPATVMALPALPLTSNGKVDRKTLPAPEASQVGSRNYAAPETPTEVALAALWSEVLRIPTVGRHDNFFELGGHSLLATQVVSRIRSTLGVELPLGDLFSAPTVAGLARRLAHAARSRTPALTRADRTSAPPLSFAQQRLWFIDQLEPGTTLYNMPLPLRLTGVVDEGALRKSLDALMARHESLRTTFRVEAGQPVQHIHAGATVPFESVDLTDIADATERQAEAERRGSVEFHRPFNLEQGPVIRALLLKLDAQEHVLMLHVHHIVSDGWSLGVLVREMTALYEAFRQGHAPALPELPVQYADFSVWQRGWLQGEVLEAQLGWWKQQLAGASHVLELPTDKPRPAVASRRGDAVTVHLPRALSEQVEALAQREGATPFMVLLAAFQSVLHRYSGQDDVLVGSPIANRGHAETEGLIGFFVNTLVLRGSFGARPSFRQIVAQVRTTTLGAYEHQDIPFERLVESLQTTRDLSRTPLFQVMFSLQNAPLPELVLPGLSVKAADIGARGTSQFELSLDLRRVADGFVGLIDYATDLFERSTVERLMTHLRVLLEAALERPDAPLADLSFVGPEERQRLLGDLSGTVADFDRGATLHGRIEAQVARTPNADAVEFEGTTLSFRQLEARANQLARHLRSLGVGPEVTVGLCLERSADSIVALLAVLKAGGAFVPLDPAAPTARRSFILGDSRASVLLTTQALAEAWRPDVGTVVCLDAEQKPWVGLSSEALASNVGPENLAYVLYTSGSTGTPKGVAVQHRSVLHLHQAMARDIYTQPRRSLRVSVNAPLFFDASMEQVIQLLDGDCLCLVPDETRKDPEAMLSWLEAQRIDALDCTPSQLKLLLDAGLLERAHVPALIFVGGEAMDEVTWRRLATTKRTRAFNMYGPTENTVNATAWAIQDAAQSLPVIGRPLDNVRAYILDAQQRLVPFGTQGELCLSGEGLARGYLGRPDLTAERFVPNPFSTEPGARLYRTGDKARWREDGTLDFMGRLDFQVKLRGYRIELGEIEATLRSHPGIRDAVALVREDMPGDARLVAYVAPEVETAPLREHLRKHLPEYMVPAAFVA